MMRIRAGSMALLLCLLLPWAYPAAADEAAPAGQLTQPGPAGELVQGEEAGDAPDDADSVEEEEEPAEDDGPQKEPKRLGFLPRLGIAFGIVIFTIILVRLMWALFRRLDEKAAAWGTRNIKPLTVKKLKVLNTKQIVDAILFTMKILKYLITVFLFYITLPIIFSLFSATRQIADTLFGYIRTPLQNIFLGTVNYIPKLITIIVILIVTRYILRALKFFATQIERGKLVFHGFYPDWAQPTFNILRVLLYAFTVAIIYPYLPGSDSKFFQGISVFVGVIFSLGSSSAIGNLVAGMVITYMRPFKAGDLIRIKDITGTVTEKSPFVIRIRNKKNEYITFPNLTVLTSEIINYNTSAEQEQGLVVHAEVTMGYTVPWPEVHRILIAAAKKTPHTEKTPEPFVLQTALDDFYARYEINVYTKEITALPQVYSGLYQHIQDGFQAEGIDLTAPHYEIHLPGDQETEESRPPSRKKTGGPAEKPAEK